MAVPAGAEVIVVTGASGIGAEMARQWPPAAIDRMAIAALKRAGGG